MQRALSARLSLSSKMIIERVYSVFLCVLLISVLFFPLAAAGRVLLGTPGKEDGDHGNGGNKIGINPSNSSQAGSALGHSSPSHATPSGVHTARSNKANRVQQAIPCGDGKAFSDCQPRREKCNIFSRKC